MINLLYFKISEFNCSHTGKNEMDPGFLEDLDELRRRVGVPFKVNSGYRDATHPAEASKDKPGTHAQGIAADIRCLSSEFRYALIKEALKMRFKGIGIAKTFIHLDKRDTEHPVMWVYD